MGYPDLVGDPKPAHQTPSNWINPHAFAVPGDFNNGIFKLGNMPSRITQLREGATKNFDFSSQKL